MGAQEGAAVLSDVVGAVVGWKESWYQETGIVMVGREFSVNPSFRRVSNSLFTTGKQTLATWITCEILIFVVLSKSRGENKQ